MERDAGESFLENEVEDDNIECMLEFTKKIGGDPTNSVNYVNRSRHFVKLGHYYYALEDARKLIYEICPRSPDGYKLMSEIYSHAELYEQATKSLDVGLRMCGRDFKDYKKLKHLIQIKLKSQQRSERGLFCIFLLLGVAVGIGLIFINKKFLWSILGKSQITDFTILCAFPLMSCIVYFVSRRIRRKYSEAKIMPPFDIIGDPAMQSMRGLCPELSESLGDKKAF